MDMTKPRTLEEEMGLGADMGGVDGNRIAGAPSDSEVDHPHDPLLSDLDPSSLSASDDSCPDGRPPSPISLDALPVATGSGQDAAAAERFKYAICSSGLLDKDFLVDRHESAPPTANTESRDRPDDAFTPNPVWQSIDWQQSVRWARAVIERWDISLAGAVLVVGIMVVVGWRRLLLGVAAVVGGVAAGAMHRLRNNHRLSTPASPPVAPREASPATAPSNHLDSFLGASTSLDSALRSSLNLLESSSNITFRKQHRLSLHQAAESLNGHLADASSVLGGLVDKNEFKVLANMYDITVSRRQAENGSRKGYEDWEGHAGHLQDEAGGSIPSPSRPSVDRLFGTPPTVRPARPRSMALAPVRTSWDMNTSQTLPTTPLHTGHSRHLSLLPSLPVNIQSATPLTDRFTSIPRRTPRLSKRSSWDPDAWKRAKDTDGPSQLYAPIAIGNQLSPSPSHPAHTPKRTSPLSGKSHEMPSRSSLTESALRLAALGSPSAPASKRSSLQARLPASANPNRRSLQSLTYFPSDASDMLRTASSSTTVSDLQQSRERASDGDRRRRMSIRSNLSISSMQSSPSHNRHSASFPPGPILGALPRLPVALAAQLPDRDRVASLSPLTHPALQAACLGVHLRRRRVACELLALKWQHPSEEANEAYWAQVHDALGALTQRLEEGIATLVTACEAAKEDGSAKHQDQRDSLDMPPWRAQQPLDGVLSTINFAPRTPLEERLFDRISSIQKQLDAAWTASSRAQAALSQGDAAQGPEAVANLTRVWGEMHRAMGEISRDLGAGRNMLQDAARARPSSPDVSSEEGAVSLGGSDELPDFIRSWESDSHTARSTSIGTVLSDAPHDPADPALVGNDDHDSDALPAVGKDEIFEVLTDPAAGKRDEGLSAMSRHERIALSRKAREMGMTLKELVQLGPNDENALADVARKRQAEQQAQMARLGLVDELQGLMGAIQKRKEA